MREQLGWPAPGTKIAFLALPDENGEVHSGAQLFGDAAPQPQSDNPNGFLALALRDWDNDGVIDNRDTVWPLLRLWIDLDHNGGAQSNELFTLESKGVRSISLKYQESRRVDQYGNRFRYRGKIGTDNGEHQIYDVAFVLAK